MRHPVDGHARRSSAPSSWCQLLFLLLLSIWVSSIQGHGGHDMPEWLVGLPQLLLQQQHLLAGSILSATPPAAAKQEQLLRPRHLPAAGLAHLATFEQSAGKEEGFPTLASVAHLYGISQRHLQQMMERDPGLLASKQGLLVWACSGEHRCASLQTAMNGSASSSQDGSGMGTGEGAGDTQNGHAVEVDKINWVMRTPSYETSTASKSDDSRRLAPDNDITRIAIAPALPEVDAEDLTVSTDDAIRASLRAISNDGAAVEGLHQHAMVFQQPGPEPQPQEAFKLHNRPPGSVHHTIFLDFRGCSISDTYWNTATKKAVLQTQPFDMDGDPNAFSVQERQAIVSIWQAVAQDFVAWAVDVTTEDPGVDALVRTSIEDKQYGMHVCVGGSSATTVGGLSGGLAFTGAWGQLGPTLQPVLVFPRQLGNGHPRAIADSISHEVGHTFGLAHFGGSGAAPYNDGMGPWGPLLGLPYARVLSQWSKGTAITGNLQDDLQAISQQLPSLADDHGDSPATATVLCHSQIPQSAAKQVLPQGLVCKQLKPKQSPGANDPQQGRLTRALVRGVISNGTDQDLFAVQVGRAGLIRVALQLPSSASGFGVNNLLAKVSIMGPQAREVLSAGQPETGDEVVLQASAQVEHPGTYYISVVPTGVSAVSSYGSLGDYLLTVTFPSELASHHSSGATATQATMPGLNAASTAVKGCHGERCRGCPAAQGLVLKSGAHGRSGRTANSAAADTAHPQCQYQEVKPLSFHMNACSTATAGTVALLNFTVSSPPACFEGSIIAAAPQTQLLQDCPCRQNSRQLVHWLPVPRPGGLLAAPDGSYTCQAGVYTYTWTTPSEAGCYRLSISLADGGNVATVLRVVTTQHARQ